MSSTELLHVALGIHENVRTEAAGALAVTAHDVRMLSGSLAGHISLTASRSSIFGVPSRVEPQFGGRDADELTGWTLGQ